MKLLIDADGCPVVLQAAEIARRQRVPVILVADWAHEYNMENVEIVTVSKGADSADFALVNRVEPFDIVVTQDYGLAAMALAKKALVLDQNGREYNEENIDSLLMARSQAQRIRRGGGRLKGPKKREKIQDEAFEEALQKLILRIQHVLSKMNA